MAFHAGYIHLALPVFHIGYYKDVLQVLQCICKTCSCVLMRNEQKAKVLRCAP